MDGGSGLQAFPTSRLLEGLTLKAKVPGIVYLGRNLMDRDILRATVSL